MLGLAPLLVSLFGFAAVSTVVERKATATATAKKAKADALASAKRRTTQAAALTDAEEVAQEMGVNPSVVAGALPQISGATMLQGKDAVRAWLQTNVNNRVFYLDPAVSEGGRLAKAEIDRARAELGGRDSTIALDTSKTLFTINELDKRFAPMLRRYWWSTLGGIAGSGIPGVLDPQPVQSWRVAYAGMPMSEPNRSWTLTNPREINDIRTTKVPQGGDPFKAGGIGLPSVTYMAPIWWRRSIAQAMSRAFDRVDPIDVLGLDAILNDRTGQVNEDFAAWASTYSISYGETEVLARARNKPAEPSFWDSLWTGIKQSATSLLTLDFQGAASKVPANLLAWAGSGYASGGESSSRPTLPPLSPEEKRIVAWLSSNFVAAPSPISYGNDGQWLGGEDTKRDAGWILRMDLALSGFVPLFHVLDFSFGGIEAFERALIFATAPNGEAVIGGSREDYKRPGQLTVRAVMLARRSLAGIEDRYAYGPVTNLSLRGVGIYPAPTRSWLERQWVGVKDNIQEQIKRLSLIRTRRGLPAESLGTSSGLVSLENTETQAALAEIGRWKGTLPVYGIDSPAITKSAIMNEFTGWQQGGATNVPPNYKPPLYAKYGIAGFVRNDQRGWVSGPTVTDIAKDNNLAGLSLIPQGREILRSGGV